MQLRWSMTILAETSWRSSLCVPNCTDSKSPTAEHREISFQQESTQTGVELLAKTQILMPSGQARHFIEQLQWSHFLHHSLFLFSVFWSLLIPLFCLAYCFRFSSHLKWMISPIIYEFPSHFNYSSPSCYQIVIFILLYIDNIFLHLSSANCITTYPLCTWVIIKNIK